MIADHQHVPEQEDLLQDIGVPFEHVFSSNMKLFTVCGFGICVGADKMKNVEFSEDIFANLEACAPALTLGAEASTLMAAAYFASNFVADALSQTFLKKPAICAPPLRIGILLLGFGLTIAKAIPYAFDQTEDCFPPVAQAEKQKRFEVHRDYVENRRKVRHWRDGLVPKP